jgi:hypothetical protein
MDAAAEVGRVVSTRTDESGGDDSTGAGFGIGGGAGVVAAGSRTSSPDGVGVGDAGNGVRIGELIGAGPGDSVG